MLFVTPSCTARLEDPQQLEQVLAAWLEDEPLSNAVPADHQARGAGQGPSSSRAAEQQTAHAWGPMERCPVLRVCSLGQANDSSSSSPEQRWHRQHLSSEISAGNLPAPLKGAAEPGPGTAAAAVTCDTHCQAAVADGSLLHVRCQADLKVGMVLPLSGIATADAAVQAAAGAHSASSSPTAATGQGFAAQAAAVVIPGHQLFSVVGCSCGMMQMTALQQQQQQGTSLFEEGVEQDLWLQSLAVVA